MKLKLIIAIFTLLYLSCKDSPSNKYNQFYSIIDDLVRIQYYDSSTIIMLNLDTIKPFIPKIEKTVIDLDTIDLYEPKPHKLYAEFITKDILTSLYKSKLIDSIDIEFLFNQADKIKIYNLDKNKINHQTISASELEQLRKNSDVDKFFDTLKKAYGAWSYTRISQPLFTKDEKTIIFYISHYCGSLCGSGHRVIMKFEKGKWRIKQNKRTWVS